MEQDKIIFGAAYYEEYLPYDRLEQDMDLMAEAGINTIRIAESTWSVEEPRPGEYDFSHVDRVIASAARRGISVIVGTPTYAVPVWLTELDPGVLAVTKEGPGRYGPRQIMDITNPTYLRYAEGIIRALVSHTAREKNVIGFQIDNETKHYGTAGPRVIARFRRWMADRFGTVDAMNDALGFSYWSNSVTSFEDLPDPSGTVNGSYACEFAMFQRELAVEFLRWQADIVSEYKRADQFIMQNFDFAWRTYDPSGRMGGYHHGVQPDMDHYAAAKCLTLVGADVYCPGQDALTGMEIAFAGDEMRPLGGGRYLLAETQAQGVPEVMPYPGQLRLMAYSHLAAGAVGVMYWHWSSTHSGLENWFQGILSHDFTPGPVYDEVKRVGQELPRLANRLAGYKKKSRAAVIVSTEALTALKHYPVDDELDYNDILLWIYRAAYELNIECDVIYAREEDWSGYDLLLIPALYTADYPFIYRLRDFVKAGGTVFAVFRSFTADSHAKIYHGRLPHELTDLFGMRWSQVTRPVGVTVDGAPAGHWMELLEPAGADVAAWYEHKHWSRYAAVTRHDFGAGRAWYVGTMTDREVLKKYLCRAAKEAGLALPSERFPLVVREGVSGAGRTIRFLLNYSDREEGCLARMCASDLLTGQRYETGDVVCLEPWGVCILEESE